MIQRTEEWWKNRVAKEADHVVNAGLAREVPPFIDHQPSINASDKPSEMRFAFGKFVELMRRSRGWTMERLAVEADLELEDVVMIEDEPTSIPEPRAVYQLATLFEVSLSSLLQMSGLSKEKDPALRHNTLRFAARSQSLERLTNAEQEALDEFVSALGKHS
jgi:HTH-type transcriptional regulator, competence development regulator